MMSGRPSSLSRSSAKIFNLLLKGVEVLDAVLLWVSTINFTRFLRGFAIPSLRDVSDLSADFRRSGTLEPASEHSY